MKILFIVHDQIDTFHLLPLLEILPETDKIDLFVINRKAYKNRLINSSLKELRLNDLVIYRSVVLSKLRFILSKIWPSCNIIPKLLSFCLPNIKSYDCVITDFSLNVDGTPPLKQDLLNQARYCIGIVHGISLNARLRLDRYSSDRVSLLNESFDKILYSDETWGRFLKQSGVKNLQFFPAVRYSEFYNREIKKKMTGRLSKNKLQINTNKKIMLYIDGAVRLDSCRNSLVKELNDVISLNEYFIIFKLKPRDYKSILHDVDLNEDCKIITNEYTVEELLTISDLAISRLSGSIITTYHFGVPVVISTLCNYSMDLISRTTIHQPLVSLLESFPDYNTGFIDFIGKNRLNLTREEYEDWFKEIIEDD